MFIKFNNGASHTKISYNINTDNLSFESIANNIVRINLYDLKNHKKFIEEYINEKYKLKDDIKWKYDSNTSLTITNNFIYYKKNDNNDSLNMSFRFENTYTNTSFLKQKLFTLFKDILLYWNNPFGFIVKYADSIESISSNNEYDKEEVPF